ncbi:predicted protein [Nematostella vectensis]|uniref:Transmembrane protein adipocyte-associated 1 homolog n=1 Tax=Nematostella vectensis TaxID=45351 RepID=A7S9X7_NEMVE|nr:predicted protein [Nematostella vectensis]|eukprot:XP_001631564.1 predicted protein [Nematostella vectensis]
MIVWELSTTGPTNRTVPTIIIDYAICTEVLYKTSGSWIRICDIVLLAPNAMFMVFLFYSLGLAHAKLVGTRCPIVKTIYTLLLLYGIHYTLNSQAFWLLLRCLLLSVELSVIIFGVCAANLDSRSSVRRVLLFTSASAVLFTSAQAVLEFTQDGIHSPYGGTYNLFQHGGMIFWFASSMLFFVMYFSLLILPCISFGRRLRLPGKPSFYRYCGFLALINILQSIGSALIYYHITFGTCILDVTVFTYFALFAPLVYVTFLAEFMSSPSQTVLQLKRRRDYLPNLHTGHIRNKCYVEQASHTGHAGQASHTGHIRNKSYVEQASHTGHIRNKSYVEQASHTGHAEQASHTGHMQNGRHIRDMRDRRHIRDIYVTRVTWNRRHIRDIYVTRVTWNRRHIRDMRNRRHIRGMWNMHHIRDIYVTRRYADQASHTGHMWKRNHITSHMGHVEQASHTRHMQNRRHIRDICRMGVTYGTYAEQASHTGHMRNRRHIRDICRMGVTYGTYAEQASRTGHMQNGRHIRDICGTSVTYGTYAEQASRTGHMQNGRHIRDICGTSVTYGTYAEQASRTGHMRNKRHVRDICGISVTYGTYAEQASRTRHMRNKRHVRDICGASVTYGTYAEQASRTGHMRSRAARNSHRI